MTRAQARLLEVLQWCLTYHSVWFEWFEIVPPGGG